MFFLLYKHPDDGVFDVFPKISEDSPKLFRRPDERSRIFPIISENSRRCTKISEDCRRLSRETRRCFDDTPTNSSTIQETNVISPKSSISSHVKISYLHMWRYHIFTCEDIVSFLSICYHPLYHWLLYNKSWFRATAHLICHWCLYIFLEIASSAENVVFKMAIIVIAIKNVVMFGDYFSDNSENEIIELSLIDDKWAPKFRYYWGFMLMSRRAFFVTNPLFSLLSLFSG